MNIGASEALVLLAVLLFGLLAFLLVRSGRHSQVDAWASAHGITLNDRTEQIAETYLQRNARFRFTGAVLGFVLPLGSDVPGLEMIGGYLAGAILAEVTARPIVTSREARASLVPRELGQYIPAYAIKLFRALSIAAAAVAMTWYLVPEGRDRSTDPEIGPVAAAAGAIILLLVVEASLRYIIRRPQPAAEASLLDLDDAIRSASMHATIGAGIGIAFLLLGASAWAVGFRSDIEIVRWIAPFAGIFCLFAGISFWAQLGHDTPWRVKRTHLPQVDA